MAFEQSSSFYESSSDAGVGLGGNLGEFEEDGYSSFESSSANYGAGSGAVSSYGFSAGYAGAGNLSQANDSSFGFLSGNQNTSESVFVDGNGFNATSSAEQASSSTMTSTYAANAQGIFQDPNPRLIRRPAAEGSRRYVQRVIVKFLQPPPLPPPGPLIIKEVRPPQPAPPPPLYIRQRPAPPPVLPPLVIREAPPKMPPVVPAQVITKTLPPLPVPPRSVIIERLPPVPPKPRDVIVERWLPYRIQQKRKIIIQRAPPAPVQKPRNIIIYYEPPKAQIVRRFLNLGIQRANPNEYVARYGTQLEDSQSLLQRARQVGVVEDISPPARPGFSNFQSESFESYGSGANVGGGFNLVSGSANAYESNAEISATAASSRDLAGAGFLSSGGFSYNSVDDEASGNLSSSYETSSTSYGGNGVFSGLDFGDDINNINGGFSSYQSYSS